MFATRVGQTVALVWRHTSSATAVSEANPRYSGTGLITEYVPMSGAVGDVKVGSVSIVAAGSRTRAVT